MKIRVLKSLGAVVGAVSLIALGALPASAHVTVSSDTTEPGAYALLTFSVPHGCGLSPTTEVEIMLPETGIGPVTPSINPNWEVERNRDASGSVTSVVYTAEEPLAADIRDSFELSALILPDAQGDLIFPVIQRCEQGQEAWDEVAQEGEDPHDLEHPAPFLTLTQPGTVDKGTTPDGAGPVAWTGLGLGVFAVVLSTATLLRGKPSRRGSETSK